MSASPVSGSLSTAYTTAATGISSTFTPQVAPSSTPAVTSNPIPFNVNIDTLTGSFVGTVIVQKSVPTATATAGTYWAAVIFPAATSTNSTAFSGTSFGQSVNLTESQSGVLYRIIVSAYTSGTLYYQFGQ